MRSAGRLDCGRVAHGSEASGEALLAGDQCGGRWWASHPGLSLELLELLHEADSAWSEDGHEIHLVQYRCYSEEEKSTSNPPHVFRGVLHKLLHVFRANCLHGRIVDFLIRGKIRDSQSQIIWMRLQC